MATIVELSDLSPSERTDFNRFVTIAEATPYDRFPESEVDKVARNFRAGHLANVAEDNPGTPLAHAMLAYFLENRVPGEARSQILIGFYKQG